MSLPTAGDLAAMSDWLRTDGLRRALVEARPDIAVEFHPSQRWLIADLPPTPTGSRTRVSIGLARNGYERCWFVVGAGRRAFVRTGWSAGSSEQTLAQAFWSTYDACAEDVALPSPWRWLEPTMSAAVEVADLLAEQGHDVTAVAANERLTPEATREGEEFGRAPDRFGQLVQIERGERWTLTLSQRATLGWVLDARHSYATRRLDLAALLGRGASTKPGVRDVSAADLAEAIRQAASSLPSGEAFLDALPQWQPWHSLHEAAAGWLRELGYPDAYAIGWNEGCAATELHVCVSVKDSSLGLKDVKVQFADAALAGKPLVLFGRAGFTKQAREFADSAGIALFVLYDDARKISAGNALAQEHLPETL